VLAPAAVPLLVAPPLSLLFAPLLLLRPVVFELRLVGLYWDIICAPADDVYYCVVPCLVFSPPGRVLFLPPTPLVIACPAALELPIAAPEP